jgi:hypothetical protein
VKTRRQLALATALAALSFLGPNAGAQPARAGGRPGTVQATLNADPKEVHEALLGALSEWRIQKQSRKDGIVKTAWVTRENLRETYRERVVAEFAPDGYLTRLTVRHERQRRMKEMKPTLSAGAAPWGDWEGKHEVARNVLRSVEQALGLEAPALDLDNISGRPPAQPGIVVERERIVPASVAPRVNDLKAKRRSLVQEIRAIDGRILAAVYGDRYEEIREEVEALKERKATLEARVAAIDREILELVLAEDG